MMSFSVTWNLPRFTFFIPDDKPLCFVPLYVNLLGFLLVFFLYKPVIFCSVGGLNITLLLEPRLTPVVKVLLILLIILLKNNYLSIGYADLKM